MPANPVLAGFMKKYHAVRATDSGPSWSTATDEALLGWLETHEPIARFRWNKALGRAATPEEIHAVLPAYHEIAAEVLTRGMRPGASDAMFVAAITLRLPFSQ